MKEMGKINEKDARKMINVKKMHGMVREIASLLFCYSLLVDS